MLWLFTHVLEVHGNIREIRTHERETTAGDSIGNRAFAWLMRGVDTTEYGARKLDDAIQP